MRSLVFSLMIVISFVATVPGCAAKKYDTSLLTAQEKQMLHLVDVVRGVNDVSTAAIAANKALTLTDPATAAVLTINKQVLDTIQANPKGNWLGLVTPAIKNTRDALPLDVNQSIGTYVDKTLAILTAAQGGQ